MRHEPQQKKDLNKSDAGVSDWVSGFVPHPNLRAKIHRIKRIVRQNQILIKKSLTSHRLQVKSVSKILTARNRKDMILKGLSVNIMKKNLDFSNKIRHFSSKQARATPGLCKIRESTFIVLRRSFSAIAA